MAGGRPRALCPGGISSMALFQTQASSKASRVASSTTSDVSNLTLTCKRFAHSFSVLFPVSAVVFLCSVSSCIPSTLLQIILHTLFTILGGLVNYVKIDPPGAHVLAFWSSANLSSRADHLRSQKAWHRGRSICVSIRSAFSPARFRLPFDQLIPRVYGSAILSCSLRDLVVYFLMGPKHHSYTTN